MKYIFSALALTTCLAFTSCIDEVFPESGTATESQMSDAGLESAINGINSQMCQGYLVYGSQTHETDMGYPQLMIAFTEMMGDMYPEGSNSGYDWYRTYNTMSGSMASSSYFSFLPWRTLYMFVKSANDAIKTFRAMENPKDEDIAYAAMAYTARAFDYYLLTVLFEPVENKYTDVSKVLGLTVPIVTDETTEDQAINNPRASHQDMMDFIIGDLKKAVELFTSVNFSTRNHSNPDLAVAQGLLAKVYLWDQNYKEAFEWADKAIATAENGGAVMMTKSELTGASTAFTSATKGWLWYTHYSAENMGNLCNFVGWMSGEADWGYSSLSMPSIDKSLYDKMGINDYRRKQFLDPNRKRGDYETVRSEEFIADAPAYLSLKFRCKNGDWETYSIGGETDIPIMRLEELYLVRAEAAGMTQGYAAGVALLQDWVQKYRDPAYKCHATDERSMQIAVLDQMRIEFWGEGNAFPSAKRIKPGVMQYYDGTNAPASIFYINAEGIKPDWTLVIPDNETQNNKGIQENNPDPTNSINGSKAVKGQYAPGNF